MCLSHDEKFHVNSQKRAGRQKPPDILYTVEQLFLPRPYCAYCMYVYAPLQIPYLKVRFDPSHMQAETAAATALLTLLLADSSLPVDYR